MSEPKNTVSAKAVYMEERKRNEIEHYDRLAREWKERAARGKATGDIEMTDVMRMRSYRELYRILARLTPGKRVLDYGCGHGMHAVEIAKMGAREVTGIDLSRESLAIAEDRVRREGVADRVKFIEMDAERLNFPAETFDLVFDGGAFSSIDVRKAYREIARVLKPGGRLVGIETMGHHPIANIKRWLNAKRGIRTAWAAAHIMKMKDLRAAQELFEPEEVRFFHVLGLLALPLLRLPGGAWFVKLADFLDDALFAVFPFIKRYGFKVVFVMKRK